MSRKRARWRAERAATEQYQEIADKLKRTRDYKKRKLWEQEKKFENTLKQNLEKFTLN